jgi:PAS domain S-box-containing protein
MTNEPPTPTSLTTPVASTQGSHSGLSRSPFERINGPEANAALQDTYQSAHRIVGLLLVAHAVGAISVAAVQSAPWWIMATAAAIPVFFWVFLTFARRSAWSRQVAALALFGFVVLHAWRAPGNDAVQGLFFAMLAVLVLYQDAHCIWPAASAAVVAYVFHATSTHGSVPPGIWSHAAVALGAVAVCSLCAQRLRKNTLSSLRKQSVLASENARIAAELEKTRRTLLDHPDLSLGSRSGFGRSPGGAKDSASLSRITEERYRMVIETAFDAIVLIDADTGLIVDLNPRALEMLKRSAAEVIAQEHVILYSPAKAAIYRAIFKRAAKGELRTLELELVDRDGLAIPAEVAFSVSRLPQQRLVQGVFRDLTERKRADAEKTAITVRLQEAQRLESLNVLAGGIAHDFNNILMSILGFATIGRDRSANSPTVAGYFAKIESSTLRAGELCRQMLAFAGRAQVSIHAGDLNEAIRSFEEPLRTKLPSNIQLEMSLWPELPTTNFDTAQLGQVIVSLVTNATEAIGQMPGLIQIKTFGSPADDPTRAEGFITPEIPSEYCAVIEVTDTGCGISAEHLRRIFEPFFSTKFIGRGLGLSETLGMIRSHKGAIQVRTRPGEGASFRLYFPTTVQVFVAEEPVPPAKLAGVEELRLALVVDDEATIRELVGSMLEDSGYVVRYAANGTEALDLFQQLGQQVSLVMLDLAMPGVPSHHVLEKIRSTAQREVRVFVMSGYSEGDARERCGSFRPDGFLAKPFSIDHLKAAIGS